MAVTEDIILRYLVDIQKLVDGVADLKDELANVQKKQDETLTALQNKIDDSTKKVNSMNTIIKRAGATIVSEIGIAAAKAFTRFADDVKKAAVQTGKLKKETEDLEGAYADLTTIIGQKLAPALANKLLPVLTDIINAIGQLIESGQIFGKALDEDVAANVKNVEDRLDALEKKGFSAQQRLGLLNDAIERQTKLIKEGDTDLIQARARATVRELEQLGRTLGLIRDDLEEEPIFAPLREEFEEFVGRQETGLLTEVADGLELVKEKLKEVRQEALDSPEDFGPMFDRLSEIHESSVLAASGLSAFGDAFVAGAQLAGAEAERLAKFQQKVASFQQALTAFTIITEQAKALAQGIQASTKAGTVIGIIARIATITAAVLTAFASVKQIFSSAQLPQEAPTFAKGVIRLQGPGTQTSDSILARLSKDESVMTAAESIEHEGALRAMRKRKFDSYIMQDYLPKLANKNADFADRLAVSLGYDDNGRDMVKLMRQGNRTANKNTERMIRAILAGNRSNRRGWK